MTIETIAVIAVLILGFGLFSAYFEKTVITPPIIFVTFGLLLSPPFLGLINFNPDNQGIILLAELTLILVLFTTVMITILTSIFIHGLTAFPAVNWYGKQMEQVSEHLPEMKVVSELPVRLPWRNSQNES